MLFLPWPLPCTCRVRGSSAELQELLRLVLLLAVAPGVCRSLLWFPFLLKVVYRSGAALLE